jgi:uncharacterized membrane protein HdeD (DUF308 family)
MAVRAKNWWIDVLRGVAAIIFGGVAFLLADLTFQMLLIVFCIYVVIDGVIAVAAGASAKTHGHSGWAQIGEGITGVVAGIALLVLPGFVDYIVYLVIGAIGFWAIATGLLVLVQSIRLREEIEGELLLVVAGALSILVGVLMLLNPETTIMVFVWLLGAYALVTGVIYVYLGLKLRRLREGEASA